VLPLFGAVVELTSVSDAIFFLEKPPLPTDKIEFQRYELTIRFSNGDELRGLFKTKDRAIDFLHSL